MTRDDVKNLRHGQVIYHCKEKNADGTPMRARVTGRFQEQKRTGKWWRPVKYGLRGTFRVHAINVDTWKLTEEEVQG